MAVRYLWSFTLNKYDSGPKLDLNRRYVLKSGLSRALRPSCHSLMKCSFTWDWQCILNSTVLPDIRTLYVCAISWTFDNHVSKPWWCNPSNSEYTDFFMESHSLLGFLSTAHWSSPYTVSRGLRIHFANRLWAHTLNHVKICVDPTWKIVLRLGQHCTVICDRNRIHFMESHWLLGFLSTAHWSSPYTVSRGLRIHFANRLWAHTLNHVKICVDPTWKIVLRLGQHLHMLRLLGCRDAVKFLTWFYSKQT